MLSRQSLSILHLNRVLSALGTTSKTRADKRTVAQNKSTSTLQDLSEFDQFCQTLCSADGRTLNPSNFMDYVAVLISIYTGTDQTVSIQKWSANKHSNGNVLAITNIDSLIPIIGPRDKITFQNPDFSKIHQIQIREDEDGKEEVEESKDDEQVQ